MTPATKRQLPLVRGKVYDPVAHGAKCRECPLNKCKPVPPSSVDHPLFVIVGEAPGRLEVQQGVPFIGPSGKLLDRVLDRNRLDRRDAHVTNSVLCRPESELDLAEAQIACAPRFFKELGAVDPKVPILALGAASAKMTLGVRGILRSRGFIWTVPTLDAKELKRAQTAAVDSESANTKLKPLRNVLAGRTVLPMLHPAFILRSEIWAAILHVDMARAAKLIVEGKLKLEDQSPYVIVSSATELTKQARKIGPAVTVDIETDSPNPLTAHLTCVGIGDTKQTIVAYPWKESMVKVLTDVFATRTIVGHNIIGFDAIVLRRYGAKMAAETIEDTMLAHHAFASHLPKSLLHVASVYTDAAPWKQIAKGEGGKSEKGQPTQIDKLSPEALTKYNAGDVRLTALSWDRMQGDLEAEKIIYENDKHMGILCAEMRRHGMRFDVEYARDLAKTLQGRKNALLGDMRKITRNPSFSPSRPNDIRKALFGRFHVTVIRPTPTGLPSTARAVLETLRDNDTKAGRLSDLILRWRAADKTKGTYLTVELGEDGRVHGDWRLGPQTGRLACRMMTLPRYTPEDKVVKREVQRIMATHGRDPTKAEMGRIITNAVDPTDRVRACYVAAKGWKFVYFDLSQAEMRFAANLSGDQNFIESCKGDVHAGNARVLFPEAVADGSLIDDKAAKTKGKKFRDIAKNAGFAVTYLAEWETVYAYLTSHGFPVSTREVRAMLDRLHTTYAGYFEYVNRNVDFVRRHGYFRTAAMGRIRWFGQYPKPTEVANYPVQGGIADHMNERLLKVNALLLAKFRRDAHIVAQIHDAAIIECRESVVEDVKAIIHSVYDPPILLPSRAGFVVPVDLKVGDRWSDFG